MSALEKESPMTAAEVAEYLGIGKSTVYQLPIPYYSYGSRRVYDIKDVKEYKNTCRCVNIRMGEPSLSLTASSTDSDSALQSYFQKRGLLDSAKSTTKKKRQGSTQLQLVKKSTQP